LDDDMQTDIARLVPPADSLHPACIDWAVERFAPVLTAAGPELALGLLDRARVLAALHRGPYGVETLNARIAGRLHADWPALSGVGSSEGHQHGTPVMITANDYQVGLYNGDVGLFWQDADGRLRAYFRAADGSLRTLSVRQLPPHVCAYALTVHKSQGSEFDEVLLVLPPAPHPLATRELLYTAVTRARKRVTVHAGEAVLRCACNARVQRTSALADRLGWPMQPIGASASNGDLKIWGRYTRFSDSCSWTT
jgi:exodeoxyribonuclease V alpha subunit